MVKLTKSMLKMLERASSKSSGRAYAQSWETQHGWRSKSSWGVRDVAAIRRLCELGLMTDLDSEFSSDVPYHGFRRTFFWEVTATITDAGRKALEESKNATVLERP